MNGQYTAASFTKNFAWHTSFRALHLATTKGFSRGLAPIARDSWRERSRIGDPYRELIPMNFFLYSLRCFDNDFILVDRLAETAIERPYDQDFSRLGLFAFHLAKSGRWRKSKWADGRVAGWANEMIRDHVWKNGSWTESALQDKPLERFINDKIEGTPKTKRKMFTNYRHMLRCAGVLLDGRLRPFDFGEPWVTDAIQLFWDREIFDGALPAGADLSEYEDAFFKHEIFKLLGCDESQGRALVEAAFLEYSRARIVERVEQLRKINSREPLAARSIRRRN